MSQPKPPRNPREEIDALHAEIADLEAELTSVPAMVVASQVRPAIDRIRAQASQHLLAPPKLLEVPGAPQVGEEVRHPSGLEGPVLSRFTLAESPPEAYVLIFDRNTGRVVQVKASEVSTATSLSAATQAPPSPPSTPTTTPYKVGQSVLWNGSPATVLEIVSETPPRYRIRRSDGVEVSVDLSELTPTG